MLEPTAHAQARHDEQGRVNNASNISRFARSVAVAAQHSKVVNPPDHRSPLQPRSFVVEGEQRGKSLAVRNKSLAVLKAGQYVRREGSNAPGAMGWTQEDVAQSDLHGAIDKLTSGVRVQSD
jgi:hypothetical protein